MLYTSGQDIFPLNLSRHTMNFGCLALQVTWFSAEHLLEASPPFNNQSTEIRHILRLRNINLWHYFTVYELSAFLQIPPHSLLSSMDCTLDWHVDDSQRGFVVPLGNTKTLLLNIFLEKQALRYHPPFVSPVFPVTSGEFSLGGFSDSSFPWLAASFSACLRLASSRRWAISSWVNGLHCILKHQYLIMPFVLK